MEHKLKTSIYYLRHNRRNRKDDTEKEVSIMIWIPHTRERIVVGTGIFFKSEHWDKKTGRVRRTHPNFRDLNYQVTKALTDIQSIELECVRDGRIFTRKEFKHRRLNPAIKFMLREIADVMEYRVDTLSISDRTTDSIKQTQKLVVKFDNCRVFECNPTWVKEWNEWMIGQGYAHNTIWKHHKNLRSCIAEDIKYDRWPIQIPNPYDKFEISQNPKEIIPLSEEELKLLDSLKLEGDEQVVMDMFLFSCNTGLRYSDMFFPISSITHTDSGRILRLKMRKTQRQVVLPLTTLFNGKPDKIIKKYPNGFSQMHNSYCNKVLQELCKRAGIERNITFHVARHTFGTRLAAKNLSENHIKNLMGIIQSETVAIYIKLAGISSAEYLKTIQW